MTSSLLLLAWKVQLQFFFIPRCIYNFLLRFLFARYSTTDANKRKLFLHLAEIRVVNFKTFNFLNKFQLPDFRRTLPYDPPSHFLFGLVSYISLSQHY
jgi:hypothetical protein